MKGLSQHLMNNGRTKKGMLIPVLLICFIAVSLLSGIFVFAHANHVHDHNGIGGDCTACAQIQNAENIFKQLGMASNGSFIVPAGFCAAAAIINSLSSDVAVLSPVTSKIRMNN